MSKDLVDKQKRILAEARGFADSAEVKGLTEERKAELDRQFDAAMVEYDRIESTLEREHKLSTAEKQARENEERALDSGVPLIRRPNGSDATVIEDRSKLTENAFTRYVRYGLEALSPEQREALGGLRAYTSGEERALSSGVPAAGGFTVPQGFIASIESAQKLGGPMLNPDIVNILRTDTGILMPMPTDDDTANEGALLAENTAVGEEDVVFNQMSLSAYTYTSKAVRVSQVLLQDSAFSMDDFLREKLGFRLSRINNRHLTVGDGVGKPTGIVTSALAGATSAVAQAVTVDDLLELIHSIDPAYRDGPGFKLMFNDNTLLRLRKLKDGQGRYIWTQGSITEGVPSKLLDYNYSVNPIMANVGATGTVPVIAGDFKKYTTRISREVTFVRTSDRYIDSLQVGFFLFNRIDGKLLQPNAVKKLTML
jgi:HK97 family phage major capsid protein